jgi:hypothetical protein
MWDKNGTRVEIAVKSQADILESPPREERQVFSS